MFKIEDHGKTIFQTPRANNHVLAKPILYPKTSKTSLQ